MNDEEREIDADLDVAYAWMGDGWVTAMAVDQHQRIVDELKAEVETMTMISDTYSRMFEEEADALEAAKAENAKLREALTQITEWSSHTLQLAVDHGSIGVSDYYRNIAQAALDATKPCPHGSDGACKQCYMEETK